MRVKITGDSATTEQIRSLSVALHRVNMTGQLQVGVNGPDHWGFSTPNLTPSEFCKVAWALIRDNPSNDAIALRDLLQDQ